MNFIVHQLLHINLTTALAIILGGMLEVMIGIEIFEKLEKNEQLAEVMFKINDKVDEFIAAYILELFVHIPWLENRIRSYRLWEKDIKAMSRKGYKVFDGDKGRFVKELSPAVMYLFK